MKPPTSVGEPTYDQRVFVNCPFDDAYRPLQRALVFVLLTCGLEPQLSESKDAATARLTQIKALIRTCRYSVHDISRCEPLLPDDLPRFNMPFELGLDFGYKEYGPAAARTKMVLVLEAKQYRYQKVLSDSVV